MLFHDQQSGVWGICFPITYLNHDQQSGSGGFYFLEHTVKKKPSWKNSIAKYPGVDAHDGGCDEPDAHDAADDDGDGDKCNDDDYDGTWR